MLCTCSVSCVQVREAYLQFMITIAKMIREDKNMSKDDSFVQEEMAKVMELETEIANVSTEIETFSGSQGGSKEQEGESGLFACYLSVCMRTCMHVISAIVTCAS